MQDRKRLEKSTRNFEFPALRCALNGRSSLGKRTLDIITGKHEPKGTIFHGRMHLIVFLLIAFTVGGCSIESAATKSPTGTRGYYESESSEQSSNVGSLSVNSDSLMQVRVIRPGDQIQITVWGYPEFNTTTTVNGLGAITVPLIGEVIVAGLTVRNLRLQLVQRLSQFVKGKVRVTISDIAMSERISVMGAVNRQGNYPALYEISLVQVLNDAGGATSAANLKDIKIYRPGLRSPVIHVNLIKYLKNGNMQYVPAVGPGDVVFVPQEENFVKSISGYATEVVLLFSFFALLR